MRPSDERRKALAEGISLPAVSNFFPITRYYDAAELLYDSIQATKDDDTKLDLCYVYGKRYCRFCLESIPEHNYYGLSKYLALQNKHTRQIHQVVAILERIADKMDAEEIERQKAIEREYKNKIQAYQLQLEQQKQYQRTNNKSDVAASALDKLKLLQPPQPPQPIIATGIPIEQPPNKKQSSTRFRLEDSEDEAGVEDEIGVMPSNLVLPPPMMPPSPNHEPPLPPSYEAVVGKYHPLKVSQPITTTQTPKIMSLVKTKQHYSKLYRDAIRTGRIRVDALQTYQGRKTSSTNGCTVISALCAAHHLNYKPNITNDAIGRIIDESCGPVLRTIRHKLGLGGHALIIPSDVHDHLVDEHILHQEKFRGAAGGNVLDPEHHGEFLKLLTEHGNTKAGATFFFREHVISIVKCIDFTTGSVSFDWIDSLPSASHGRGTRTVCADAAALQTQLLNYVSAKLPDSAEKMPWDDSMADLDPRVFQGFVWGDDNPPS